MSRRPRIAVALSFAAASVLIATGAAVTVASAVAARAVDGAGDEPAAVIALATPERTGSGCTRDRAPRCPAAARALVERAAESGCPWARAHVDAVRDAAPAVEAPRGDLIASTERGER